MLYWIEELVWWLIDLLWFWKETDDGTREVALTKKEEEEERAKRKS